MFAIDKSSISNLPSIKVDGIYRVLGCIFSTPASLVGFTPLRAIRSFNLDPSQWKEVDYQWYKNPINDQGSTSSCVGQGCSAGMHIAYQQSGRSFVEFNPYFLYGLVNGGRDAGAMISDALNALKEYGICEKNEIRPGMMYKNQFPAAAFENAKKYKLLQAFRCETFEEICTAITMGFSCPLGIFVDENFSRLDGQGVCGVPNSTRGGGHCILGMGLKKSSRYGWLIKIQNSWGRWGMKGYGYIHKGHFSRMHPDAFAIQSII